MPIRKLRIAASLGDAILGLKTDSQNRGSQNADDWIEFFEDKWEDLQRSFKA